MTRRRVMIATVTAGAGHLQAAAALEEAWRRLRPKDAVERVDVLDFTPPLYKKLYAQGYVKLVEHAPELYALIFKKTDDPPLVAKLTRWRRRLARLSAPGFVRRLRSFQPDVVLCPHWLPLEIMGGLASTSGPGPLKVCVVTDFEAHALWMEPCADLTCVAAEETKARLVARGVARDAVAATGIPVSRRFSPRAGARAARRRLGLGEDRPTLLVLAGGFGVGPVEAVLKEIDKLDPAVQVLAVAGRNEGLRRRLASLRLRRSARVFGFVDNMQELMAASDLIITKPGGLTSSEALAIGRPLLILNPIPGQEAANSDFLLERGVAVKANRVEDLPYRLETLLKGRRLAAMARAAAALGRPKAAETVCRLALERLAAR